LICCGFSIIFFDLVIAFYLLSELGTFGEVFINFVGVFK